MRKFLFKAGNEVIGYEYEGMANGMKDARKLHAALVKSYKYVMCYEVEVASPLDFEEEFELRYNEDAYFDCKENGIRYL